MKVTYPYRAVIWGEESILEGWRDGNLFTDKGEFTFRQLYGVFPYQSARLLEIAMLQLDEKGSWLLNGCELPFLQTLPGGQRLLGLTSAEALRVNARQVHAVAWVQTNNTKYNNGQLDGILRFWKTAPKPVFANANAFEGSHSTATANVRPSHCAIPSGRHDPIWLTEFRWVGQVCKHPAEGQFGSISNEAELLLAQLKPLKPLKPQTANAPVEAVKLAKRKLTKLRRPKPAARFEKDFSVAMIPQKNGTEKPLTIETELRGLIMKIMVAGGNSPRTDLRKGKSETFQPEKLLISKNAKQLIKVGLFGTYKSGRTTVFWAKQSAG